MSILVHGILAWFMPKNYTNELNSVLDKHTKRFILELERVPLKDSSGLFDEFMQNENVSFIQLYNEKGQEIAVPTSIKNEDEISSDVSYAVEESGTASLFDEDAPAISSTYYFSFADSKDRYMLTIYGSADEVTELEQSFLKILPFLLCIIAGVSLVVSWLYSYLITRPVLKISHIAKKMSSLNLEWKIEEKRSDELGVLEKSLNTLSKDLQAALSDLTCANKQLELDIERERQFEQAQTNLFSAASHELKTPITILKGQLEGMILQIGSYKNRDKYLMRSLEVVNNLESMVQQILTISRLETAHVTDTSESIDITSYIKEYLQESENVVAHKELNIQFEHPENAEVYGNRILLEKVFSNLIGNAIQYSPQYARIYIKLKEEDGKLFFSVENSGTHIEESELSKIFGSFYRIDPSRNRSTGGSGLGLYIVQKILEQYGSRCEVCNTDDGVKFYFSIASHKSQIQPKEIPN